LHFNDLSCSKQEGSCHAEEAAAMALFFLSTKAENPFHNK